ncbi:MAG: ATP-dependent helicase [Candidatus Nanoarchaeia archaeon]
MITFKEKPDKEEELFDSLHPIVKKWFESKFKNFALSQLYSIKEINAQKNILVSAPTGSGKTLTAFLSILNELIILSENNLLENKVYAVYISPLKALNSDVQINLIEPLKEMEKIAGKEFGIKVLVRTGDTTASEKAKMLKKSPHILITTPETLSIVISTIKFKENLKNVRYLVIDELHSIAESKRGTNLSISIERLQHYCENEITRIGLSATCEPIEEIAKFLVGSSRDCIISRIDLSKKMDIKVLSPVPDLINITYEKKHDELYNLLDKLIQEHKTTLIFTNTRSATEKVVHHLKERFPKNYTENIGAHHGSLSKEHRQNIEQQLREGKLKCIVCSTSLELGIDIGYIDLVILLGSPKSIARAIQRIGRSGHSLHETIKGRFVVMDRDDLVECSVMLKNVIERKVDKIHIPKDCLDVLAQQIYGIAITEMIHIDSLFKMIKKAYPYSDLERKDFQEVIDYLAGKYSSLEDRHIYAKIWYDEESKMIGKRGKLARVIYMSNIGTIPEQSFITIKIGEQAIGHVDEGFLEKLKRNDIFLLGGNTYKFLFARGMVAQVLASERKQPTVPSWFSEMLPMNFDLALEINRFRGLMKEKFDSKKSEEDILKFINEYLYVDSNAGKAIYEYFKEQYYYTNKNIPNPKELIIEFLKEDEKNYVIFHSLYGRRVNDVLSRAIAFAISRIQHKDVEIGISDNGFYIASPEDRKIQVLRAFKYIKSSELRKVLELAIENSEVLKRRFRHCAARSLMILRNYKGREKRVGRQQVSSMILMNAVKMVSKDFCILREAKREVLEDLMDIDNATKILKDIEDGKIKIKEISTSIPSPFAFNLVLAGHLDFLKLEEKAEFIKRMHSYILAKINK